MPYVARDVQKQISAIYAEPQVDATEKLPATHPEVLAFLFDNQEDAQDFRQSFQGGELRDMHLSDLGLVRVLEDLIIVLVKKNVIRYEDLPKQALQRLKVREKTRQYLQDIKQAIQTTDKQPVE